MSPHYPLVVTPSQFLCLSWRPDLAPEWALSPSPALRLLLCFPRSSAGLHIFPPGSPRYAALCLRRLVGQQEGSFASFLACPARRRPLILYHPSPPVWANLQAWGCLEGAVLLDSCEVEKRQNPLNTFPRGWHLLSASCPFPRRGPCSGGPAVPEPAASGAGEGDGAGKGRPGGSPSPVAAADTPHLPA